MLTDVLNNEIKKHHDLIMKKQDEFLQSQITKLRTFFMSAGVHCDPDLTQFAKDIAPFLTVKTTQADYRNGAIAIASKLEASEYLKAFMFLDVFERDDTLKEKF